MANLAQLQFLTSAAGENLLNQLTQEDLSESNTLRLLTRLRKEHSGEEAGAALEMARLRLKAVDKFGADAVRMLFTREALEQASDPLVRAYRASESRQIGRERSIIDACCGIGADSLAFAAVGAQVLGLDMDVERIEIARYNAATLGLAAQFETADVRNELPDAEMVFFDPARRDANGKRLSDVERYQPPLSTMNNWPHPHIIVKLSPGVELAQLQNYGGMVEFISVNGDLKEAVLHSGRGNTQSGLKATLLSADRVLHWHNPSEDFQPMNIKLPTAAPRGWLVEPDAALIRAGLVQDAAAQFGGTMLDETIAYFTTDSAPESPWARAWRIRDWMPFNLKHLRAYLRKRNVGQVTVKKRGTAITPDELIPKLKLSGENTCTLVLTRFQGQQIVMVCD